MEQGSLKEHHLEAAVLGEVSGSKKIAMGAAIGNDYAECEGMITADGFGNTPMEAFYKARSNFLCALGTIKMMRIHMCLPVHVRQGQIRNWMESFSKLAKEEEIPIVGGQSQVSANFVKESFFVELTGMKDGFRIDRKASRGGDDIVMIGNAGSYGTLRVIGEKKEELRKVFSESFLAKSELACTPVFPAVVEKLLKDFGEERQVTFHGLHDVSGAGVYTALWQLGKSLGKGMQVENRRIPICQECIEICEIFDINPYLLDSLGSFLVVTSEGKQLAAYVREAGIPCEIIGKLTLEKERIVCFGEDEHRTLTSDTVDELNKIL